MMMTMTMICDDLMCT